MNEFCVSEKKLLCMCRYLFYTNGDYARAQHKAFRVFMKSSWSRDSKDQGS